MIVFPVKGAALYADVFLLSLFLLRLSMIPVCFTDCSGTRKKDELPAGLEIMSD